MPVDGAHADARVARDIVDLRIGAALRERRSRALQDPRAIALIETDMVTAMQSASERADRLSMFATYFGRPDSRKNWRPRSRSWRVVSSPSMPDRH